MLKKLLAADKEFISEYSNREEKYMKRKLIFIEKELPWYKRKIAKPKLSIN
jgi:hypothetical protein